MTSLERYDPTPRRSSYVKYNGLVHIGGQTCTTRPAPIEVQVREVLARIDTLLAHAGTDKSRLISVQIWLQDVERDFAPMNAIWDEWTAPGASPTRVTVKADLANPQVLVEMTAIAAVEN